MEVENRIENKKKEERGKVAQLKRQKKRYLRLEKEQMALLMECQKRQQREIENFKNLINQSN